MSSKSPDLVLRMVRGHLFRHFAILPLIWEAGNKAQVDLVRIGIVTALRIARRSFSAVRDLFPSGG